MAFDVGDNAYCSVADITDLLGGFTVPAAWGDSEVEDAIIASSQIIGSLTRTHWGKTTLTFELSGEGDEYLQFSRFTEWPIISITSVRNKQVYVNGQSWSASDDLDADSYRIAESRRGLYRVANLSARVTGAIDLPLNKAIWRRGHLNYQIIGVFGNNEIIEPVIAACVFMVRDRITPGTSLKYETAAVERWPDGYSVDRRTQSRGSGAGLEQLTGSPVVDGLLRPFVAGSIMMINIDSGFA